jgi:hypothetical protein
VVARAATGGRDAVSPALPRNHYIAKDEQPGRRPPCLKKLPAENARARKRPQNAFNGNPGLKFCSRPPTTG